MHATKLMRAIDCAVRYQRAKLLEIVTFNTNLCCCCCCLESVISSEPGKRFSCCTRRQQQLD